MEKQSELLQEGAFCPFFDVGGNKKQNETGYGRDSSFSAGDLAKINLHERTLGRNRTLVKEELIYVMIQLTLTASLMV